MIFIDGYPIDVAVTEEHTFDSEVTDNPVEADADITDHVRNRPEVVRVEGIVSDHPLTAMRELRTGTLLPSEDAFVNLLVIRENKEPVTLETSLQVYHKMMLQNLTIPRSAAQSGGLFFSATFKKAELVTNARQTVRVAVPRAKKKKNKGQQGSPDAEAAGQKKPPNIIKVQSSSLNDIFD